MKLAAEEEAMRGGAFGPLRRWAIEHQIKVGTYLSAADFVPVAQAELLTYKAAWLYDNGHDAAVEGSAIGGSVCLALFFETAGAAAVTAPRRVRNASPDRKSTSASAVSRK